jgi:hypothetical protein
MSKLWILLDTNNYLFYSLISIVLLALAIISAEIWLENKEKPPIRR